MITIKQIRQLYEESDYVPALRDLKTGKTWRGKSRQWHIDIMTRNHKLNKKLNKGELESGRLEPGFIHKISGKYFHRKELSNSDRPDNQLHGRDT